MDSKRSFLSLYIYSNLAFKESYVSTPSFTLELILSYALKKWFVSVRSKKSSSSLKKSSCFFLFRFLSSISLSLSLHSYLGLDFGNFYFKLIVSFCSSSASWSRNSLTRRFYESLMFIRLFSEPLNKPFIFSICFFKILLRCSTLLTVANYFCERFLCLKDSKSNSEKSFLANPKRILKVILQVGVLVWVLALILLILEVLYFLIVEVHAPVRKF